MRDAFISELLRVAETNEKIVLVVGDLGYSVVEAFEKRFPDRFFNAGVAEQAMIGLAAGMASEGKHVFVYSIGNFPTFRPAEQIRNDIDYHNLPVTIVAVGGGMAYGNLGYSHHAVQDFGLMRLFPNMTIAAPASALETVEATRYLASNPSPSYLRLGKSGEQEFFTNHAPIVSGGDWVFVSGDLTSKIAIVATGGSLSYAMDYGEKMNEDGKSFALFTLPVWGLAFKESQKEQANPYDQIITFEDHIIDGGFGSWMREALVDGEGYTRPKILTKGLSTEVLGMVGSQDELNRLGGL